MRKLPDIIIERSLQESGWHRDYDNEWINPSQPNLSFSSTEQVLHHEWWNALGRVVKAEERYRKHRDQLLTAWMCAYATLGTLIFVLLFDYLRSR